MIILYISQQTITCSKSATETLEVTEDNPNENTFKKQPPEAFYKKSVLIYFAKFIGKHLCISLFFDKVAWGLQLYQKNFGAGVFQRILRNF